MGKHESELFLAFMRIIHSSKKFSKFFAEKEFGFIDDPNLGCDKGFAFDTSEWVYDYLQKECGVILKSRRSSPAYSYTQTRSSFVNPDCSEWSVIRDSEAQFFDSFY